GADWRLDSASRLDATRRSDGSPRLAGVAVQPVPQRAGDRLALRGRRPLGAGESAAPVGGRLQLADGRDRVHARSSRDSPEAAGLEHVSWPQWWGSLYFPLSPGFAGERVG